MLLSKSKQAKTGSIEIYVDIAPRRHCIYVDIAPGRHCMRKGESQGDVVSKGESQGDVVSEGPELGNRVGLTLPHDGSVRIFV